MSSGMGRLLAVSTLLLTIPRATESQVRANAIIARSPIARIHSPTFAVDRKPTSSATAVTKPIASRICTTLPRT